MSPALMRHPGFQGATERSWERFQKANLSASFVTPKSNFETVASYPHCSMEWSKASSHANAPQLGALSHICQGAPH